MLDKLRGDWAPRPSCGPHKLRECMPMSILLRQRLKYALTYKEVKLICMQRLVKVDNKIRTDMCFPAGFMDVVSLEKTNQHFRLLYDTKGRFVIHQIHKDEAAYKLCRVMSHEFGPGGNPYITTHEKHPGSYEIIHVKDASGNSFCTRISNVMVIGPASESGSAWISLPKGKGIKLTDIEDRAQRMSKSS